MSLLGAFVLASWLLVIWSAAKSPTRESNRAAATCAVLGSIVLGFWALLS